MPLIFAVNVGMKKLENDFHVGGMIWFLCGVKYAGFIEKRDGMERKESYTSGILILVMDVKYW